MKKSNPKSNTKSNYITEYHKQIKSGKIIAGHWIKLFYEFLTEGLKNKLFFFDSKKANHAIEWIEAHCYHTEGPLAPSPIKLELWQKAILSVIYGIVDKGGKRYYREIVLIMARKNGKSLFASAIAKYEWQESGYGARIYCLAPRLDQTDIIYNSIWQQTMLDPEYQKLKDAVKAGIKYHERKTVDDSNLPKHRMTDLYIAARNSTVKKIAFNDRKSDGFNPSLTICDEIASWQAIGEDASLVNRLAVYGKYKNPDYVQGGTEPEYISAHKQVIAVMHDDRVLSLTLKDRRSVSIPNEHGARRNVFEQGTVCNFVNLGHNSIVYYVDDITLNMSADSIGVATSTGTVYGTAVTSIQTSIAVNPVTKKITGTLKHLTSGSIVDVWGAGWFIALKITGITEDEYVRIGMTPSVSSGLVHIPSDDNENVFKVSDINQKFTVEVTKDGKVDTVYYDLSDLTIQN